MTESHKIRSNPAKRNQYALAALILQMVTRSKYWTAFLWWWMKSILHILSFFIRKVVDRILNNKKDIIDDKEKSNPFIHHERIPINTSEWVSPSAFLFTIFSPIYRIIKWISSAYQSDNSNKFTTEIVMLKAYNYISKYCLTWLFREYQKVFFKSFFESPLYASSSSSMLHYILM